MKGRIRVAPVVILAASGLLSALVTIAAGALMSHYVWWGASAIWAAVLLSTIRVAARQGWLLEADPVTTPFVFILLASTYPTIWMLTFAVVLGRGTIEDVTSILAIMSAVAIGLLFSLSLRLLNGEWKPILTLLAVIGTLLVMAVVPLVKLPWLIVSVEMLLSAIAGAWLQTRRIHVMVDAERQRGDATTSSTRPSGDLPGR